MRFVRWWILSLALAMLAACGSSFSTGQGQDAGGDASDETIPNINGTTPGDAGDGGPGADAGEHDAVASESGTDAGDGGAGEDAGDGAPPGCLGGGIQCGQACVPSDVHNCGVCGHDCTNLPHVGGVTSCTAGGECSFPGSACAAGWADCNGKPDDGCETDVTTPDACGSCTNVCPASDPTCAGGSCVSGCPTQTPTLCSGTCVDTSTNANDCAGCGKGCITAVANAQPTCANSACSFACNSGFTGCPAAAPASCVDEQHDANNCGACGRMCAGPTSGAGKAACAAGGCTLDCNAGLTACPTSSPTECADTTTDLSNCGSCGDACSTAVANAHATCAGSQCGFACNAGFLACGAACIPGPDGVNGAFVSQARGTGATCSAAVPCSTISAAIATGRPTIYVDAGTYQEVVSLASGVSIHGGWSFSGTVWTNCGGSSATSILSAPAGQTFAVTASSSGIWTLDTLTVENNTTALAGQSLYGIQLDAGALTLTDVRVLVSAGGAGANGVQGASGAAAAASCTADTTTNAGSAGASGQTGPGGLQGMYVSGFIPGSGGQGTTGGQPGFNGTPGSPGPTHASCGFALDGDGCTSSTTQSGMGNPGCGGGGGGSSLGGLGGGASVGVFAGNGTTVTLTGVTIQTGAGGNGGQGGVGGPGATGSQGSMGSAGAFRAGCATTPAGCKPGGVPACGCSLGATGSFNGGAAGGPGGAGGNGGAGGGGAGGDSLCYAISGGGQVTGLPSCTPGVAGTGGLDGNGTAASQGATGRSGTHN
jgi:hypothetical protein